MINIYIANLGKYNEGELVGEWLSLPCSEEELQETFVNIGVATMVNGEYSHGKVETDDDGYETFYEEYAIHDYECDIDAIKIGEYSSIDRLNSLASIFNELDEGNKKEFEALLELGYVDIDDIKDSGDVRLKLENYCFGEIDGSVGNTDLALGYLMADMNSLDTELEKLGIEGYFDYEAYGRDCRFNGTTVASNNIVIF